MAEARPAPVAVEKAAVVISGETMNSKGEPAINSWFTSLNLASSIYTPAAVGKKVPVAYNEVSVPEREKESVCERECSWERECISVRERKRECDWKKERERERETY